MIRALLVASVVLNVMSILLPGSAAAQQGPSGNQTQTASQACYSTCSSLLRTCLPSPEGRLRPEICDTGLIACSIGCDDCAVALSRCVSQSDKTESAEATCRSEMESCTQRSAAAMQDRSRPMITFTGGDGTSIENAVIIKGARNTREGIRAEAIWILKNHANWRKDRQALLTPAGGKIYDRIEYVTPTGRSAIYFEITEFFGKL
jgi:hypothetical protein